MSDEVDYGRMLDALFSVPTAIFELPAPLTQDEIQKVLEEARQFERDHPEFCVSPPPSMADWANVIVSGVSEDEKIRCRKAERMAKCDLSSGRRARGQDPDQWLQ
jgi:hypothetical protein